MLFRSNDIIESEDSISGNKIEENIVDAQGGDITSSIEAKEGVGDTAPLTGVLIDPSTGEPIQNDIDDNSPY